MKPHVTIRDVAAATGFSVNTVSRALNDKPDVSAETKRVILETARKLGYRPNRLARGLRSNKTQTIGVIVADIANPFFGAVVKEIGETARQEGWSIILASTDEDRAREREAIHVMLAERVDGLLITPCQKDRGNIEKLDSSGLPYVLLGRWFDDFPTDYVAPDEFQGGFAATEHLIELGHDRIAMIDAPLYISSARHRLAGYRQALLNHGIEPDESLITTRSLTVADGYRTAKSVLAIRPRPTAIFAYSDFVAFGVMKAVREAGLRIPEDIAVVGFDDVEFSSCLEVPLTTIRSPTKRLGKEATRVLLEKINGDGNARQELKLTVKLIVRESTVKGVIATENAEKGAGAGRRKRRN